MTFGWAVLFVSFASIQSASAHGFRKLDSTKQQHLGHVSVSSQGGDGYGLCKPCEEFALKKAGKFKSGQLEQFSTTVEKETKADANNPYIALGLEQSDIAKLCDGKAFTHVSKAFLEKTFKKSVPAADLAKLKAARDLLQDSNKRVAYDRAGPKGVALLPELIAKKYIKAHTKTKVEEESGVSSSSSDSASNTASDTDTDSQPRFAVSSARTRKAGSLGVIVEVVETIYKLCNWAADARSLFQLSGMAPLGDALNYAFETAEAAGDELKRLQADPRWIASDAKPELQAAADAALGLAEKLRGKLQDVKTNAKLGDPNNAGRLNEAEADWDRFDWKSILTLGIGNAVVTCSINSRDEQYRGKAIAEITAIRNGVDVLHAAVTDLNHMFTQSLVEAKKMRARG